MNPFNISILFFSFCNLFIGLLIFLKRNDLVGKRFFIFSIFVTIWSFFLSCLINQNISYGQALLSGRLCNVGALFIPVLWLHFVMVLINTPHAFKKLITALYILCFIIVCFSFSPLFIPKVEPEVNFIHYTRPGPLYHVYMLMFFTVIPFAFVLLGHKIKHTSGAEKTQLIGFFIATLCGFVGGGLTLIPIYKIPVPQYGLFLLPGYPFVMAYFMIRHNLFDLESIALAFEREKLATIGLLASSINHEIKNPLYIAKGLLEGSIDNQKASLEIEQKTLNQLNRISEVVLKLNRFAKPHREQLLEFANIKTAVNTVLDLVLYEFSLEQIKIKNEIPENLPLVKIDQNQLEQVLFNLIVNACHALVGGGELMIKANVTEPGIKKSVIPAIFQRESTDHGSPTRDFGDDKVLCSPRTPNPDSRITIEITDTGTGISRDHIKHIFEPFHTTKGEKGTGLGLYITKQIIERSGGRISVASKEGNGTTFRLELLIGMREI